MNNNWLIIALIGALSYGTFSFLLSFISNNIKNNRKLEFIYGNMVNLYSLFFSYIIFGIWFFYNQDKSKILFDNLNWFIVLITILFDMGTNPIHTAVINSGGSVGQQTMYSLTIIPVIVLGYLVLNQRIKYLQIMGIILASLATLIMY